VSAGVGGLQVSVRRHRGHTWIDVTGDLDLATAPALNAAIEETPHRAGQSVLLDLTMLTFCDAAGLDVLLDQHHRLGAAGGALVLLNPPPLTLRLLTVTGLDRHLDIRPPGPPAHGRRIASPAAPGPGPHSDLL
jgi:anti-anti-sigma factor